MDFDELANLYEGTWIGNQEANEDLPLTVAVNGVGHLHIIDILYCDHCKEYHIELGDKSDKA